MLHRSKNGKLAVIFFQFLIKISAWKCIFQGSRTSQIKKFFNPLFFDHGSASGVTKLSKYYIKENDIPQKHLDAARSIIGGGINAETSSNNNTHFYRDTFNYTSHPSQKGNCCYLSNCYMVWILYFCNGFDGMELIFHSFRRKADFLKFD